MNALDWSGKRWSGFRFGNGGNLGQLWLIALFSTRLLLIVSSLSLEKRSTKMLQMFPSTSMYEIEACDFIEGSTMVTPDYCLGVMTMTGKKETTVTQQSAPESPSLKAEILRTLWHTFPGFLTIFLHYLRCPLWIPFLFLIPVLIVSALFDGARLFNPELGTLLTKWLPKGFLRERELKGMSGTFWYLVGVELVLGTAAMVFQRTDLSIQHICVLSILYLAWADPAASFVGRRFGRLRPKFLNGKSIEGCLAAAIVGSCITGIFLRVPDWWNKPTVWKGGLIAAFSESVQMYGLDDNLIIPVLSACLLRASMSEAELLGLA